MKVTLRKYVGNQVNLIFRRGVGEKKAPKPKKKKKKASRLHAFTSNVGCKT